MASINKVFYCKNCKKNVTVDSLGHCKKCSSSSLNTSWSVRFRFLQNGTEKQKRLSGFETKKAAEAGYIKFLNTNSNNNTESIPLELTFSKLFEEYKNYCKNRIKESSYYDFCSKANNHIYPYFKDYYVKDMTPKIILAWQESKQNYSYKYKRNLRNCLNVILSYAERYYQITNQLHFVDNFKRNISTQEIQIWTPEEFKAFISKVKRPEYYAFFMALYYTGARKGELLATTWNDWDLTKNVVNINKSITKKVFNEQWAITSPKNQSSVRKVSIPAVLSNIMLELKKGNESNKFVFFGEKPLADSNVQRIQEVACKESGVKRIRIHDFRHSHASLLLSQNVSIVAVSKRLGHSNTQQTLNTYAHLMPREEDVLVKVLQKIATE